MSEKKSYSAVVACVKAELRQILCENCPIFVAMATRVDAENLNSTIKLADPDNPLFGANSAALALVQAQLLLIWIENGRIFVTMATRVDPMKI